MNQNSLAARRRFPPFVNWVLARLQQHELPGKHRLYQWLSKHYANKVINHQLGGIEFVVPVDEWCFWLEYGPQNYYLDEFIPFFNAINQVNKPFTFFDLGADIGTVSALAKLYCPKLHNIIAFEPNPNSFALLQHNLKQLGSPCLCENAAVSNIDGQVAFHSSPASTIDHEGSIDINKPGNTQVYSLDNWVSTKQSGEVCPFVVLKIDVEGQELQVIQGAAKLIQQAEVVLVLLEIHPDVLQQTETTAEQLFTELEKLRAFEWCVPKLNNQTIDRQRKFFAQFPLQQFDVIGCSFSTT